MSQSTRTPFHLDTRALARQPGAMRSLTRTVPALDDLNSGLAWIAEDAELQLDARLESVLDGVLVTGAVRAPMAGECARCLEPVHGSVTGEFQELFRYEAEDGEVPPPGDVGPDADSDYYLEGEWIDLQPVIRDCLVPQLPDSPLCSEDCPGLCVQCGVRLAEAEPGHGHGEAIDPRWERLRRFGSSTPE